MKYPRLFGPWRRTLQGILVLTVLAVPFITINGKPLLRLDVPSLTFFFAGEALRIEELYIFWIFGLSFIFFFLMVTLILGRVWCGWLCPQTVLSDIVDYFIDSKKFSRLGKQVVSQAIFLFLGLLIGANFVWYFIGPASFFKELMAGTLGLWSAGTVLVTAAIIYCDLAFIGRLICRDFCPYGRFQAVLVDRATLTLQAHPAHIDRCIDCKACVKACPTGIDIRKGFQIECINCTQCLDACRKVMAQKNEPSIIQYTIGQKDLGIQALLSSKTAAILAIFLCLFGAGLFLSATRSAVKLTIGRSPDRASMVLPDGRMATFYSGALINRRNEDRIFYLHARQKNGEKLSIQGPTVYALKLNEHRQFNFAVLSSKPSVEKPQALLFLLTDETGATVGEVSGFISGITDKIH